MSMNVDCRVPILEINDKPVDHDDIRDGPFLRVASTTTLYKRRVDISIENVEGIDGSIRFAIEAEQLRKAIENAVNI